MTNALTQALANHANATHTHNGAVAYNSTLDANLDFYGLAGAARNASDGGLCVLFESAYREDSNLAMKNLFHLRDVRGGKRERRAFRVCYKYLATLAPEVAIQNLQHIPEFGRWDDVVDLLQVNTIRAQVVSVIDAQLKKDIDAMQNGGTVSLLAKWMPSENTSCNKTVETARKLRLALGMKPSEYRKTLSKLRAKIHVVETQMSASNWGGINYSHVPSQASTRYRTAFARHDATRYNEWQQAVKAQLEKPVDLRDPKVKVNAATSFPHDLVSPYLTTTNSDHIDQTLENQWQSIPNYAKTNKNVLVLPDVSGSMGYGASGTPFSVSVSLAIYFAERNTGAYKNCIVAFESEPSFVNLTPGGSLRQHVTQITRKRYAGTTNLMGAFDLILDMAVKHQVPQDEMPAALVIVSDMQFDSCFSDSYDTNSTDAFSGIKARYAKAGYNMPQVVFWNVCGTENVPVMAQQSGAAFVSGLSPDIFGAFMKFIESGECMTPQKIMFNSLNADRYKRISA